MSISAVAFEKKTKLEVTYQKVQHEFSKRSGGYSLQSIANHLGIGSLYFNMLEIMSGHVAIEDFLDNMMAKASSRGIL